MSTVEEIIEAARALPPEQQAELKHRLEKLSGDETNGETGDRVKTDPRELHARIHRALYEAGLVTNPNPPPKHDRERPPPIKIRGKPLSETIIEDRR